MEIGYFLSCEEHTPVELIRGAQLAEQAGFTKAWISDHFHPWNDAEGQSPFVWAVLGGIAQATGLHLTTAVTCPTFRIHPVVVAQAAATAACMFEGRFSLGVGTGEALNEHVTGLPWPRVAVRQAMLEEAVGIIRRLWEGGQVRSTATTSTSTTPASTRFRPPRRTSSSPASAPSPRSWPRASGTVT